VTAADGLETGPNPRAFLAATVNVYEVPFVNPVIVRLVAEEPVSIGGCAVVPMYGVIS
jgi:hypothetical protein